jgi:hypothetical protein
MFFLYQEGKNCRNFSGPGFKAEVKEEGGGGRALRGDVV